MKTQKIFTHILAVVVVMLAFLLGWMVGFNEHVSLVNKAKAEEIVSPIETPAMSSARYERIYCYGHNYVIFYNSTYTDIEVWPLD